MVQSQAGDKTAYGELLDELYAILKPMIQRRVSAHLTEDIIQEVLITVHKVRHTYDPSRSFLTWLNALVSYRIADQLRFDYRHMRRIHAATHAMRLDLQTGTGAVESVREALIHLHGRQRDVVTLHKVEGYSLSEIAERLSLSVSAVKMIAHRAYEKLRTMLTEVSSE